MNGPVHAFRDRNGLPKAFSLLLLGSSLAFGLHCGSEVPPPSLSESTAALCPKRQSAKAPASLRTAFQLARQNGGGPAYRFARLASSAGFAAQNAGAGFSVGLSSAGLRLNPDRAAADPPVSVSLSRFGCAESLRPAEPVAPQQQGARVEYAHGPVTEWYLNGPAGLEHGFDVPQDPGCRGDLTFELDVSSVPGAQLQGNCGGEARLLVQAGGQQYVYGGLSAFDAQGNELPARMELSGDRLRLRVAAAGALYPVTVDPTWVQQQKLLAADRANGDLFGIAVALSADGNTALIGAYSEDDATGTATLNNGAAYVFSRSGAAWIQQQKLLAADKASDNNFGVSVALSADGNIALIGAVSASDATGTATLGNGAAYVFSRSGTAWSQQQKLLAADKANSDAFGYSVALSADGNTALIGAYAEDDATGTATTDNGAAYVFSRAGTAWSQQQKLLAANKASNDRFGTSVALSADGNTALIGAYLADDATGTATTDNGAAYVFSRSGTAWSQQQKLLAADKASTDAFGCSVALSADGNTALIGAYAEDDATGTATTDNGAAYVFSRAGTAWSQQQKLLAADKASGSLFGYSVALSADGNTALLGSPAFSGYYGAGYLFSRTGTAWTQQQNLLAADKANFQVGRSVALSADGNTVLLGAPNSIDGVGASVTGAAYVFDSRTPNGTACSTGATCLSGFCTDGVCCNLSCGGTDPTDCQACSAAAGAAVDGTCGLLPSTTVCRAAADVCDEAEQCTGQSAACPQDLFKPSTLVCRESVDPFDPPELCSGAAASCPADIDSAPLTRKAGGGLGCATSPHPIGPAGPWVLLAALVMLPLLRRRSRVPSERM